MAAAATAPRDPKSGAIKLTKEGHEAFLAFEKAGASKEFVSNPDVNPEAIKELIAAEVIESQGERRGKKYKLTKTKTQLSDDVIPSRVIITRQRKSSGNGSPAPRVSGGAAPDPKTAAKFIRYVDTNKELFLIESRKSLEASNRALAGEINKLGYDKVRKYVMDAEALSSREGWFKHLEDQFGAKTVAYFRPLLESASDEG